MADFFPSKECASHFGGLFTDKTLPSDLQVIEDSLGASGEVQISLASSLKQFAAQDAQFYVNAQSEELDNLFKYGDSDLYHYNSYGDEDKKCLVYSVDGLGNLITKAVSCNKKYQPLCLNINKENLQLFGVKCASDCPSQSVDVCKKWVDLADFNNDDYVVNGAHLCVKPCAQVQSTEAEDWCGALDVEDLGSETSANLFTYKPFVNSVEDVENYLGGKYVDVVDVETLPPDATSTTANPPLFSTTLTTANPSSANPTTAKTIKNEEILSKTSYQIWEKVSTSVSIQQKILDHLNRISPTAEKNDLVQTIQSLVRRKSPTNLISKFLNANIEQNILDIFGKMSPKNIRKAVEDLIKEYLPANIESNTGFLQNTLLTALQENADETKNKFHIRLEDKNNVNIDLPAGEITNSEKVKTFDELSVYFKLETKVKVNKVHSSEDHPNKLIPLSLLWNFASQDLYSFLYDLLQAQSYGRESFSPDELKKILSFGLSQYSYSASESYIMIGLGAPGLGIPIIRLESNQIGTKWYAIEFSHIKVISKESVYTLKFLFVAGSHCD